MMIHTIAELSDENRAARAAVAATVTPAIVQEQEIDWWQVVGGVLLGIAAVALMSTGVGAPIGAAILTYVVGGTAVVISASEITEGVTGDNPVKNTIGEEAYNTAKTATEACMFILSAGPAIYKGATKLAGKISGVFSKGSSVSAVDDVVNVADDVVHFTPMDEGPLPESIASTFRSGTYDQKVSSGENIWYRSYGGSADEIGRYWTRTEPTGPLQSVIDNALDQNLG